MVSMGRVRADMTSTYFHLAEAIIIFPLGYKQVVLQVESMSTSLLQSHIENHDPYARLCRLVRRGQKAKYRFVSATGRRCGLHILRSSLCAAVV